MTSTNYTATENAILAYYKRVASIYDATRLLFLFDRELLIEMMDLGIGDSVLEIGTGTGMNLPLISRTVGPSGRVTGLDFSPEMLALAKQRIARRDLSNVNLVLSSAESFDPGTKYQAILFSYSLSMMPEQVLTSTLSHLDKNGKLGIVDFGRFFSQTGILAELSRKWRAWHGVRPVDAAQISTLLESPTVAHRRGGYNFVFLGHNRSSRA